MARNKYPEATVTRILDTAHRLFMEKGYEKTTIQDIVDALDGLTKGAIYHHFKSKDEIIDALGTRMFLQNNPFDAVHAIPNATGLEQIRAVLLAQQQNDDYARLNHAAIPLLQNPRYLAQQLADLRTTLAPQLAALIAVGIGDGSIAPQPPQLLAESFLLHANLWLVPSLFPGTPAQLREKLAFIQSLYSAIGFPVLDDAICEACLRNVTNPTNDKSHTQ